MPDEASSAHDNRRDGFAPADCIPRLTFLQFASMAATSSGASGAVSGEKRFTTSPVRLTTNFSKFHRISGSGIGLDAVALQFFAKGTSPRLMALGCAAISAA